MNGNSVLWLAMLLLTFWHLFKLLRANPRTYRLL
jgi:hypothetical protein